MSDPASGSTSAQPIPQSPVRYSPMLINVEEKLTQEQVLAKTGGPPPSGEDVESTLSTAIVDADPFSFRNGRKTDEELVVLRQRKKGKPLENYHRKQNEVRSLSSRTARP
jgi:hypothetical protein